MPTIVASNNLTIQIENNTWSLHNGRGDSVPAIVQAQTDGISYRPSFATARHLPPEGRLAGNHITMVVVGWAVEDSSWHLGIMVTPEIAQSRGGRWCGLARWNHYDGESAEEAGRALATTLNKPFRLVPPPDAQSEGQDAAAVSATYAPHTAPPEAPPSPTSLPEVEPVQPVSLMPLPITMGDWTMDEDDSGLIWQRSHTWHRRQVVNGIFLVILTLAFAALSLGAQFSVFAPPQPDWLPLVGLILTVLMLILSVRQFFTLSRANTVLIDNQQRLVRVMRGYRSGGGSRSARTLVQSPYEGLDYILVSHVLGRRDSGNPYDRVSLEAWIHIFSPRRGFINVCYVNQADGRSLTGHSFEVRRPLDLHEINTPVHHSALYVAEMVGIPAYVEGR
ncbi:MAG TPA: hypothetical protein VKQ72_00210 [Aggregatilineales bacterium]|nr:hypothetical protein [Aggregatilineales bacterium]